MSTLPARLDVKPRYAPGMSDDDGLKPIRLNRDIFHPASGDDERHGLIGRALATGRYGDLTAEAVQWYVQQAEADRGAVRRAQDGVARVWNGLLPG